MLLEYDLLTKYTDSALVYVDGDASMSVYQDANGNNRSSLNIIQRMPSTIPIPSHKSKLLLTTLIGSIEVLKRPYSAPSEGEQHSGQEGQ